MLSSYELVVSMMMVFLSKMTYPFLLHVNYECSTMKSSDAEEMDVFGTVEFLWYLRCGCAVLRRGYQRLDMVRKQRLRSQMMSRPG